MPLPPGSFQGSAKTAKDLSPMFHGVISLAVSMLYPSAPGEQGIYWYHLQSISLFFTQYPSSSTDTNVGILAYGANYSQT